jgi:transposase
MQFALTNEEREARVTAAVRERRVRHWRRYHALLRVADGKAPEAAAAAVGCRRARVYNWRAAWQQAGIGGLVEAPHAPPTGAHTAALQRLLTTLLESDPQTDGHHATGGSVPLLHGDATRAGYPVSARTVRRTVRRLGWRWKRPQYVRGRPDPASAEKRGHCSRSSPRCWRQVGRSGWATRRGCGRCRRCGRQGRGAGRSRWS